MDTVAASNIRDLYLPVRNGRITLEDMYANYCFIFVFEICVPLFYVCLFYERYLYSVQDVTI